VTAKERVYPGKEQVKEVKDVEGGKGLGWRGTPHPGCFVERVRKLLRLWELLDTLWLKSGSKSVEVVEEK
jgi:hypothetical protein